MALPTVTRCCGCLDLKMGCILLTLISIGACAVNIGVGSWNLQYHKNREPEDNLVSMGMVMFSTLSVISNFVVLVGISMRRPGYLQFSLLFNSLFILFNFLVGIVTCLFSPEFKPHLKSPGVVAVVIISFIAGAGYCLYFLVVVNSTYRRMKLNYSRSAIPV